MYLKGINLPELMELPTGSIIKLKKKMTVAAEDITSICKARFKKKTNNKWAGKVRITTLANGKVTENVTKKRYTDHQVFEYFPYENLFVVQENSWKIKRLELTLPASDSLVGKECNEKKIDTVLAKNLSEILFGILS